MTYDVGDRVRLAVLFTNVAGAATDPTTVTLSVVKPTRGLPTEYVSPAVVKDSTGNYHYDLDLTEAGTWQYRWIGTGTLQAAEQGEVFVRMGIG